MILFASPNHGDGSREAAAHVKGKKSFHVFDLAGARLFGELLVSLDYLADTGRADRMTITDQSTACVDRNFKRKFAGCFAAHLGQCGRATFHEFDTFARLGKSEDFISNDFANREAIVHFGA